MANVKWNDSDDEPEFTNIIETPIDPFGIKTRIEYKINSKGEEVKLTKKVKVTRTDHRVNKDVKKRTQLRPYGLADSSASDIMAAEEVYMEFPKRLNKALQGDEEDLEYMQDPQFIRERRDLKAKLKKFKDELEYTEIIQRDPERRLDKPHERTDKAATNRNEDSTVRVSNISDYTTEEDLKDLFSKIGNVQRVFLARDRENKNSKGFAFIMYQYHGDAAKAIAQLNRHGYDNLLMTVEWAKPSTREK